MKRSINKILTMVGMTLTLGIAANAQMSQRYVGDIPFDFQVNGHSFTSGKYTIGPELTHGNTGVLAITNKATRDSKRLGLVGLNSAGEDEKGKLIFVKVNGSYKLSDIMTPTFAVKMKRTWTDVKVGKKGAPAPETIAIVLL